MAKLLETRGDNYTVHEYPQGAGLWDIGSDYDLRNNNEFVSSDCGIGPNYQTIGTNPPYLEAHWLTSHLCIYANVFQFASQ